MSTTLHTASHAFIEVDRISRYRNRHAFPWQKATSANAILDDFSLTLHQHERVGLLGCSGCGKSTLLRAILALDVVDSGAVYCNGKRVRPGPARTLRWYRRQVQYLPQEPASTLPPAMRVRDILNEPLRLLGHHRHASSGLAASLEQVELSPKILDKHAGSLSGGQAQRVALARALIIPGFLLALLLGPGLAILAWLPGLKVIRDLLLSLPSLLVSLPVFWLGIVLIQIFSFHLHWVSVINPSPVGGMILPVITLAVPIAAPLAQIFMRSIDQVRTQPFVAAARARGLSQQRVLFRHVLRNASLPLLTVAGLLLGELIAGALVTETVFGLNGLGQVTQQAVDAQDVNVLQAVVMISAVAYVLINLLADLVTPLLDPRLNIVSGGAR